MGGTYTEWCANPERDILRGSGLRAAIALAETEVTFHSAIDDDNDDLLSATADGLGLELRLVNRDEPVRFDYFTPMSAPSIGGRQAACDQLLEVRGDAALVFGMVERHDRKIACSSIVMDPQQPRELRGLNLSGLEFDRLAIVANASETRALGRSASVEEAAAALLGTTPASVVVTKLGALGALVTTVGGQERIPVFPTRRVWPLGSGDIFAATFAHYWAMAGADAVDSAEIASRTTAAFCMEARDDFSIVRHGKEVQALAISVPPRVYLAAPFFDLGERWLVDLVRDALRSLGAQVFSPLHDVGPGGSEVARLDLEGLDSCSAILALTDGLDGGTIFETGYATALGIPVVAYGERDLGDAGKMLEGTDAEILRDLSTAVYRSIWRAAGAPAIGES